jgi:PASTA domain
MPRPAPGYLEDDSPDDDAWPRPAPRSQPVQPRPAAAPPPRRRRSPLDVAWLVLALLGLALAGGAALWYVTLNRTKPPSHLAVPPVVGLRELAAVTRLTSEGFGVRAVEQPGKAPHGVVFAQTPAANKTLARGATVTIRVANGQRP